jgi:hypothetical protein
MPEGLTLGHVALHDSQWRTSRRRRRGSTVIRDLRLSVVSIHPQFHLNFHHSHCEDDEAIPLHSDNHLPLRGLDRRNAAN